MPDLPSTADVRLTDDELRICENFLAPLGLAGPSKQRSLSTRELVEALLQRVSSNRTWSDIESFRGRQSELGAWLDRACATAALRELSRLLLEAGSNLAKGSLGWVCAERRLERACRSIHDAFRRYRLEDLVEAFAGNYEPESLTWRATAPLEAVARESFTELVFFASADSTESKALLPRVCDLLAAGHEFCADAVVSYLVRMEWRRWPAAEEQAIREFLQASLAHRIARYSPTAWITHRWPLTECSRLFAHDLRLLTDQWERDDTLPATFQLAAFVCELQDDLWAASGAATSEGIPPALRDWLLSDRTERRLESAYMKVPHLKEAGLLAQAVDIVSRGRGIQANPG